MIFTSCKQFNVKKPNLLGGGVCGGGGGGWEEEEDWRRDQFFKTVESFQLDPI